MGDAVGSIRRWLIGLYDMKDHQNTQEAKERHAQKTDELNYDVQKPDHQSAFATNRQFALVKITVAPPVRGGARRLFAPTALLCE